MTGRVQGPPENTRRARVLATFAALFLGGMIPGGLVMLAFAPLWLVVLVVAAVAAFVAGAVTS